MTTAVTPRYKPGDTVLYDGRKWEIGSWPHNNVGMCYLTRMDKDGTLYTTTVHVGEFADLDNPDPDLVRETGPKGEPVGELADLKLVKKAAKRPASTAGEIPVLEEGEPS